jgi:hypothetical protein
MNPILLSISPNENNTPARVSDLDLAIKSFGSQIQRISDDAKQPADIMMRLGSRYIHIEVKEISDLWASKQGHIGDQLIKLIDETNEAFIIVLGSLEEARSEVPNLTTTRNPGGNKTHWVNPRIQAQNQTTLRALAADCLGECIPMFYLSRDRVLSFKEALSYGKARFMGGDPFQWTSRHKGKARKIRALMGNGIGMKNAETLLDHFKTVRNVSHASYDDLIAVSGIGRERAIAILELFG